MNPVRPAFLRPGRGQRRDSRPDPLPPAGPLHGRHRGLRSLIHLLASGAALAGLAEWAGQSPIVGRWLLSRLDSYAEREAGLEVRAARLEIHPFQGKIRLHHLEIGGDLLRAGLLEFDLDWSTLAGTLHLRRILVQDAILNLDRLHLARVHFKPRPVNAEFPLVRLDRLTVSHGLVQVREPAWGLPEGDFRFSVDGAGSAPNQIKLDLQVPGITLGHGPYAQQGSLFAALAVAGGTFDLGEGRLLLGRSRMDFEGRFLPGAGTLSLAADGHLDLAQVQQLVQPGSTRASGLLGFRGRADGPLNHPAWSATLQGRQLQAEGWPLKPGDLLATANGDWAGIRLERLRWTSQDGHLEAAGRWTPRAGAQVSFTAAAIPLAAIPGCPPSGLGRAFTAGFAGMAALAPGPAGARGDLPGLDSFSLHGTGEVLQEGHKVGGLTIDLANGRFQATSVEVALPWLEGRGRASGSLTPTGVAGIEGEATLALDAEEAARMLKAWGIGSNAGKGVTAPDVAGQARAQGRFCWGPQAGVQASGRLAVQQPRWGGVQVDRIGAEFSVGAESLRLADLIVDQGEGQVRGDLWLTWAGPSRGGAQIDLSCQATRLSLRKVLEAAGAAGLPLDGSLGGWFRVHGPFDRIGAEGHCLAEAAALDGLLLPAASADFSLDPDGHLRATDLRIAGSPELLRPGEAAPAGTLALQGCLDLDTHPGTWQVTLGGAFDSALLGLGDPSFQARVEASLRGPGAASLGPFRIPSGTLAFTEGRILLAGQGLEGLEGAASSGAGNLEAWLGWRGKTERILNLEASQEGPGQLRGTVDLNLGPDSADTGRLAAGLTRGILKDGGFKFHAQGGWSPLGLDWRGRLERLEGRFEGFQVTQRGPGTVSGDRTGMQLAMALEAGVAPAAEPGRGRSSAQTDKPFTHGFRIQGRVPFSNAAPIALNLAGTTGLADLKALYERIEQPGQYSLLADLELGGTVDLDLDLGGTPACPTLDGRLTLQGGRAEAPGAPLSANDVAFTAQFRDQEISISEAAPLRGTLAQGALTAWGRATWRADGIDRYALRATLEDFQLRDLPEGLELQGSLDTNLAGTIHDGGQCAGGVWLKRTRLRSEINLSSLILAAAAGGGKAPPDLDPSASLAKISLDLGLNLAEPWELDTNLLQLQGRPQGNFRIRGTLAKPGLLGRLELLPGGRITNLFPAGDIVLKEGSAIFQDPSSYIPKVEIQGQVEIPPYQVTLAISGPLDSLQAQPFSSPSLRQDQIFTILVDPSSAATIATSQSTIGSAAMGSGMSSAVTGLLSSMALASFQEQLRKSLNLDRVSVALRAGAGAPQTAITVGTSIDLGGYRLPLVFTHDNAGEVTTISGQTEWRLGNFVFSLGASQSTSDSLAPSGQIRHTWTPR